MKNSFYSHFFPCLQPPLHPAPRNPELAPIRRSEWFNINNRDSQGNAFTAGEKTLPLPHTHRALPKGDQVLVWDDISIPGASACPGRA